MLSIRILRRRMRGLILAVTGVAVLYFGAGVVLGEWAHEKVYSASHHVITFSRKASPLDVRLCRCSPDEDLTFRNSDGLAVAASLWGLGDGAERPGIVLLHGNTPQGRKLPLYRVLAGKLSAKGFLVLTIDFAGSGESEDPFTLGTIEALDRGKDVQAAIDYLKTLDELDAGRIYLVGHSGGAGQAFGVGITNPDVDGIVAIGPPRRVAERALDPDDREYFWERAKRSRREVQDSEFPSWYTKEIWEGRTLDADIAKYLPYFSSEGHKPLLLIDGELESKEDLEFLRNYFQSIGEPKQYVTIADSDHYANTTRFEWLTAYDRTAVRDTVNAIDAWAASQTVD